MCLGVFLYQFGQGENYKTIKLLKSIIIPTEMTHYSIHFQGVYHPVCTASIGSDQSLRKASLFVSSFVLHVLWAAQHRSNNTVFDSGKFKTSEWAEPGFLTCPCFRHKCCVSPLIISTGICDFKNSNFSWISVNIDVPFMCQVNNLAISDLFPAIYTLCLVKLLYF